MGQVVERTTEVCPFCAGEISAGAVKCRHCAEWVDGRRPARGFPQTSRQGFSNGQPVWHLVMLSLATFSLYQFYWFYRNWRHLRSYRDVSIRPGWRTLGLFVPILGYVLAYSQLRDLRDFSGEACDCDAYSPGWIFIIWFVLNALWRLPDPFWLLALSSVWPLSIVQAVLNSYWRKEQPDLPVRTRLSGRQIFLLVIGGMALAIVLLGAIAGLIEPGEAVPTATALLRNYGEFPLL